jgi:predicted DNA-binding transcriptional regulator YafY
VTLTKREQFRVLREVLALAEERRGVQVDEAAAELGVDEADLRAALELVLFLEWRDATGVLVGDAGAYILWEDGLLQIDEGHWLRSIASTPPSGAAALRLLLAGMVAQAVAAPTPALDRAVAKLRAIVAADVVVEPELPRFVPVCQRAHDEGDVLRVRYASERYDAPREFTIECHRVASKWGNWYVMAKRDGDADARPFRIDRIVAAEPTGDRFTVDEAVRLPDWFAMPEAVVTVRVAPDELDRVPAPSRTLRRTDLDDGRVEVDIAVLGEHRVDRLLATLGADAEVVAPDGAAERRRAFARQLLRHYRD